MLHNAWASVGDQKHSTKNRDAVVKRADSTLQPVESVSLIACFRAAVSHRLRSSTDGPAKPSAVVSRKISNKDS